MKLFLAALGQTILLYGCALLGFVAGVASPSLRVSHEVSRTAANVRTYDFDWLIAVLLGYGLLLLVGAVRKRIRTSWVASTIALVLTIGIVVLFTQIGIKDTAIY